MRPAGTALRAIAAIASALVVLTPRARAAEPVDRIWFCPGPGTLDFIELFQHPEEWPRARALVNVFKVYQGHTQTPPPSAFLPNSYDALASAGVFRTLVQWNKKIAVEAGSVKEFYCTPDASGMNESITNTLNSIRAVQQAGGVVSYIAMDEPFVSGRSRVCGGPALEPTANRVAQYVATVTAAYPNTKIGLIEAYPFSSEAAIETIVQLLKARNAAPAFLHMDIDWHLAGGAAFIRDMSRMQSFAASQGIPFGVIITGYSGAADALYALDVGGIVDLMSRTFGSWAHMPDQLIFQSFAVSPTGQDIVPNNLPEDHPYTHTNMLWEELRRLQGSTGSPTGTAVIRR
ncbi:MAG TPA: hypothetical protein VFZ98_06545 [Vicinamibacterales bacterium]